MEVQLAFQLFMAVVMFALTIGLQMLATVGALWLRGRATPTGAPISAIGAAAQVGALTTALLVLAFVQSLIWAFMYLWTSGFQTFHDALFFSLSCFSTLGFANFLPPRGYDVLAALQGIVGSLSMGSSAAIIVAAAHSYYMELHRRAGVSLDL